MIRSELVARVAEQNPHLYERDVEAVVNALLDRMTAALSNGDRVELRGFGMFSIKETAARTGWNPLNGKVIAVKAKRHITFKPSKAIQNRLNRVGAGPEDKAERLLGTSRLISLPRLSSK